MNPSSSHFAGLVALPLLCLSAASLADDNWGYWRGPDSSGAASENAEPPVEWSESQNVKWKIAIPGEGSGTPIVWGDRVFLQTAVKAGDAAGSPPPAAPAAGSDRRSRGSGGKG